MSRRRFRKLVAGLVMALIGLVAIKAAPNQPAVAVVPTSDVSLAVEKVYDGDTIALRMNGTLEKIRLIGIDTPETSDPRKPVQCFGKEASNWTKSQLEGRRVRIEADNSQGVRDKYDRLLAYVWRDDGLFINQALIEQGYAHEYTYQTPYSWQADFKTREQAARAASRGLWDAATCAGDTKQKAK